MKALFSILMTIIFSVHAPAQGLQDGGQSSGGDEKAEYTIAVHASWNIVSVPVAASDYAKTSLFPTATSAAFTFQGGYTKRDTLQNGKGYWMKFATPQSVSLSGLVIETESLAVNTGWNMVGSISDPVPVSSVVAIGTVVQSGFFSFGNGYEVATSIEPGKGYWVKASSAGMLVLSSGSPAPESVHDSLAKVMATLNTLTITDASGNQRTLLFGDKATGREGFFELPPVPPAGIFDARFVSQKLVALTDEAIVLESAIYPVEVRWSVTSPGDYALLIDGKETPLSTTGSIQISQPKSHISLRIGPSAELPKEFALSQNYPNPFNPVTTIRYALPVDSRVTAELYNMLGQRVRILINDDIKAGYHAAEWNGTGNAGQHLGSGVYFVRLSARGLDGRAFTDTRKMLLLK